MPQVRVEVTDLLLVKVVTDNLEVSHNKTEAKDLSIVNISFRIIDIREAHHNKIILNTAITVNPISRETNSYRGHGCGCSPQHIRGHGHGRANYQSSNGAYQYKYYMHDPQPEQYGPPCSLCSGFNHSPKHCYKGEHDINNIMEKMSINPHQSQMGIMTTPMSPLRRN